MSIGDADAAISINCKNTNGTYEANIKYYVMDYYDWNPNKHSVGAGLVSDKEMYKLHTAGVAREFKTIGVYNTNIKWERGERMWALVDNQLLIR